MKYNVKKCVWSFVFVLSLLAAWRLDSQSPGRSATVPSRDAQLAQLLKERYETGASLLQTEEKRLHQGVTTLARVCEVSRWVRDSAVELPGEMGERLAALTNYVELTKRLEDSLHRALEVGAAAPADILAARYLRLDAEVTLLRAKGQSAQ